MTLSAIQVFWANVWLEERRAVVLFEFEWSKQACESASSSLPPIQKIKMLNKIPKYFPNRLLDGLLASQRLNFNFLLTSFCHKLISLAKKSFTVLLFGLLQTSFHLALLLNLNSFYDLIYFNLKITCACPLFPTVFSSFWNWRKVPTRRLLKRRRLLQFWDLSNVKIIMENEPD